MKNDFYIMASKRISLLCCIIFIVLLSEQQISSLVIQRFGGYAVFRNNSGSMEYLVVKPTGTEFWTLPNEYAVNETTDPVAAKEVLEKHVGLKEEDVKKIPEYVKTITDKLKDHMNQTTYRVAELRNPFHPISISSAFSAFRWLPFHDLMHIQSVGIRNALSEIEDFIEPFGYI